LFVTVSMGALTLVPGVVNSATPTASSIVCVFGNFAFDFGIANKFKSSPVLLREIGFLVTLSSPDSFIKGDWILAPSLFAFLSSFT